MTLLCLTGGWVVLIVWIALVMSQCHLMLLGGLVLWVFARYRYHSCDGRVVRIVAMLFIYMLLCCWVSYRLPVRLELPLSRHKTTVVVQVMTMPRHHASHLFWVGQVVQSDQRNLVGHRVWVSAYHVTQVVKVGEQWALTLTLRAIDQAHSFSWVTWCRQQGIVATAVIDARAPMVRMADTRHHFLLQYRYRIAQQIASSIPQHDIAALMSAMTVGVRSGLSTSQWLVLQRTGTSHLLAVSGLHIALVALALYRLVFIVAGWWMHLERHGWLPLMADSVSVLAAGVYGMVSGWALPVQRAWWMLLLMMLMRLTRLHLSALQRLGLALTMVLLVSPTAWRSASCWLSFTAVSCLMYSVWCQPRNMPWWRTWWLMQSTLIIGLLPLEAYFFGQTSWVAPWVNVIAIPWFSLVALPVCLLALIVASVCPHMVNISWHLAAWSVMPLWFCLHQVAAWVNVVPLVGQSSFRVMGWAVASVLCLSPRMLGWQVVGWCLLLLLAVGR